MTDMTSLVFYASLLNNPVAFGEMIKQIDRQEGWIRAEALSYHVPTKDQVNRLAHGRISEAWWPQEAEVEIIRIEGLVKPHFHRLHDAVALCMGLTPENPPRTWDLARGKGWVNAEPDQILLIQRGVVHGFTLENTRGDQCDPFYLLTLNSQPFTEGDVVYV